LEGAKQALLVLNRNDIASLKGAKIEGAIKELMECT
jgi:hypothetical protein